MSKVYHGQRCEDKNLVLVHEGESSKELNPRYDLYNHSPNGFEWGYLGSGPAQLALAILADCTDDEFACEYYQVFKEDVIAKIDINTREWELTSAEILRAVSRY